MSSVSPGENVGSLLNLFQSKFFSAWLALSYLYRSTLNPGVVDYLCERLYDLSSESWEIYIHQLCNLLVHHHFAGRAGPSLERFLLDQCAGSLHMALKINYALQSIGEHDGTVVTSAGNVVSLPPELSTAEEANLAAQLHGAPLVEIPTKRRIEKLRALCDTAAIDAMRPGMARKAAGGSNATEQGNGGLDETSILSSIENAKKKERRCDWMHSVQDFVNHLSQLGKEVTSLAVEQRANRLRLALQFINAKLEQSFGISSSISSLSISVAATSTQSSLDSGVPPPPQQTTRNGISPISNAETWMPGMYLPLSRVGEPHFAIVRIPEREVTLLTAKDRAPYMLFLEIITLPPTGAVESSNGSIPSDGIVPVSAEASPKADEPKALIQSSPQCGAKDIDALGKAYADHIKAFWPRPARTPSPSPSPSSTSALSSTPSTASPVTAVVAPVPSKETPLAQLTRQAHPPLELERLETKKQRVQQSSPFGHIPGWDLMPVIVKYGSDALQEQMALQLIDQFSNIFQEAGLPLILTPNRILVLDSDTCFLQPLVNTISVHQLKKYNNNMSIVEFLKKRHGAAAFPQVQRRFLCSLAAYSLLYRLLRPSSSYFVRCSGFMLWNTPGSLNFETAPFKFTQEYIDVLGPQDEWLPEFKKMFFDGLVAARRCMDRIVQLTRMSILGVSADKVPCAIGGEQMMLDFEARFGMQMTQEELASHVDYLTTASLSSWSTIHYDRYQYHTRGILW